VNPLFRGRKANQHLFERKFRNQYSPTYTDRRDFAALDRLIDGNLSDPKNLGDLNNGKDGWAGGFVWHCASRKLVRFNVELTCIFAAAKQVLPILVE
jgi:hypothetical protein